MHAREFDRLAGACVNAQDVRLIDSERVQGIDRRERILLERQGSLEPIRVSEADSIGDDD